MSLDLHFSREVGWHNITHNLGRMADAAGIYEILWRPEDSGIWHAGDMIAPLSAALELLMADPERFRKLDSPNGWGDYDSFVGFVRDVLKTCRDFPEADVYASR